MFNLEIKTNGEWWLKATYPTEAEAIEAGVSDIYFNANCEDARVQWANLPEPTDKNDWNPKGRWSDYPSHISSGSGAGLACLVVRPMNIYKDRELAERMATLKTAEAISHNLDITYEAKPISNGWYKVQAKAN